MYGETMLNTPVEAKVCCGNCVCFVRDAMKLDQGQCHRHPPQIVSVSAKTLQGMAMVPGAMFPQVSEDAWCAEFKQGTKSAETAQ